MQEQSSDNNFQPRRNWLKIAWKVFFWFIVSIGAIVFIIIFLAIPHVVKMGDDVLFQNNKTYFSEKISYLFREPQIGDRIVFRNVQFPVEVDSIGLIAEIKQEKGLTRYMVLSTSNSSNPWIITRDKIKSRVYFPLSSEDVVSKILTDEQWKITPTPVPLRLPIAGEPRLYNQLSLPEGWIKFESTDKKYYLFHPKNLEEGIDSDGVNASFLLGSNSAGTKYLEIFVKRITLQPGEDVGRAIYKDTGLSKIPTFEQIVVNGSIPGYQIARDVDNSSRYLKTVYLPSENSVYTISMRTPRPMSDITYEEIFEKIVGSFRFAY